MDKSKLVAGVIRLIWCVVNIHNEIFIGGNMYENISCYRYAERFY